MAVLQISCMQLASALVSPSARLARPGSGARLGAVLDGADAYHMWLVAAAAAYGGTQLEKTPLGRGLSGPVCAMLLSAAATNLGLLPPASPRMAELQSLAVALALPLLLLAADLRAILADTGALLKAFLLGSAATLFGSALGFALLLPQIRAIGSNGDGWKIVAALTAKNIGGGLNFVAVSEYFRTSAPTVSAGLAVDNVLGLLYFPLVARLGSPPFTSLRDAAALQSPSLPSPSDSSEQRAKDPSDAVEASVLSLLVALSIVAVSRGLASAMCVSAAVVSTLLSVALATGFPRQLSSFAATSDTLGRALLMLFFGSIGNSAGTFAALVGSPDIATLLRFNLILYAAHLAVVLGFGRALRIPMPDLLLASNANIGNGATASSLATSKGWTGRVAPALLVGSLGNAIATATAVALGEGVLAKHF